MTPGASLRRVCVIERLVPGAGIEPALPRGEADFKSAASAVPPPRRGIRRGRIDVIHYASHAVHLALTASESGRLRPAQQPRQAALASIDVPGVQGALAPGAVQRDHGALDGVLRSLGAFGGAFGNRLTRPADECPYCPIAAAVHLAPPQ